jgi:hypothetical protein
VNASFRNGVLLMALCKSARAQRRASASRSTRGEEGLSAEIAANAKEVVQCCN